MGASVAGLLRSPEERTSFLTRPPSPWKEAGPASARPPALLAAVDLPLWVAGTMMLPTIRAVNCLWHPGGWQSEEGTFLEARREALALAARTSLVEFLAARAPRGTGPWGDASLHPADARVLFAWLQALTGRNLRDLAEDVGWSHETLRKYARGDWPVETPALPSLAGGVKAPAWLLEGVMLPAIRTVRLVAAHPRRETLLAGWDAALCSAPESARLDGVWYSAGELLAAARRRGGAGEPVVADGLWRRLEGHGTAARMLLVKRCPEFHTTEPVERLCAESREAASDSARAALRLALLALRAARLVQEDARQPEGYALVHVANARRVAG